MKTTILITAILCIASVQASQFNITAKDQSTGNFLSTFNATISYYDNTGYYFYQETATLATSEGGLSNGSYGFTTSPLVNGSSTSWNDGDYSTALAVGLVGSNPYFPNASMYVNYSKPTNANSAIAQSKTNLSTSASLTYRHNATIPSNCFSQNQIMLYYYLQTTSANSSCWNGTAWQLLRTVSAGNTFYFFEEGIWWNATNYTQVTASTTTSNLTVNINTTRANITVNANNYISTSTTNHLISGNYSANLTKRYVNITIYDETNLSLLNTTTVSILLETDTTSNNYTTNNGSYVIQGIETGTYTLKASAAGYPQRSYIIIVPETGLNTTTYLAPAASAVTFTVVDSNSGSVVQSANIEMQRLINTTFTTVESASTEITGTATFNYIASTRYKFIVSKESYTTREFFLDPITETAYTIQLTPTGSFNSSQDFSRVSVILSGQNNITHNELSTLEATFFSPYNEFSNYTITAIYPTTLGVSTTTATGSTAAGSTLTIQFNATANSIFDTVNVTLTYTSTTSGLHTYNYRFTINDVPQHGLFINLGSDAYGMGALERIIVATIVTLGLAGLIGTYAGPAAGGIIALFIFGLLIATGFIPWWAAAISILSGFALISWGSGR